MQRHQQEPETDQDPPEIAGSGVGAPEEQKSEQDQHRRDRDHVEDCPATRDMDSTRVEAYDQGIPVTAAPREKVGDPGGTCTVARCLDCGGMRIMRGTVRDNLRSVVAAQSSTEPTEE